MKEVMQLLEGEKKASLTLKNGLPAVFYPLNHPEVAEVARMCADRHSRKWGEYRVPLEEIPEHLALKITVDSKSAYFVFDRNLTPQEIIDLLEQNNSLIPALIFAKLIIYDGRIYHQGRLRGRIIKAFNKGVTPEVYALMD
jgi:hypothetical protein